MTPFEIRFVVGGSLEVTPPTGDNLPDLSVDEDAILASFKQSLTELLADELVHDGATLSLDVTAVYRAKPPELVVPSWPE